VPAAGFPAELAGADTIGVIYDETGAARLE
jgi:hypothetical protein